MSTQADGTYLEGYPFNGQVYGLTPLSDCVNVTGMQQDFSYADPDVTKYPDAVELTNALNASQIGSFPTPGYNADDLPESAEAIYPWTGNSGTVTRSEAFYDKCWNRTIPLTAACTENCIQYIPNLFNATWVNFGEIYCSQTYPTADAIDSTENPVPPDGNVNMVLTNQCAQYVYGPPDGSDNVTMYTIKDTFGNTYALQSTLGDLSEESWAELVDSVVLPEGWEMSSEVLTSQQEHFSYLIGDDCWLVVLKDSNGNAWHQLTYGAPLEESPFLAQIGSCPPLVQSTSPSPAITPDASVAWSQGGLIHLLLLLITLVFLLK
ncbi:hypothetical protein M9434_000346 [Picochlorum sp. BPE23]|nr:hypothetical protein M9434_000346 [Picochlorum sp. BPE23]